MTIRTLRQHFKESTLFREAVLLARYGATGLRLPPTREPLMSQWSLNYDDRALFKVTQREDGLALAVVRPQTQQSIVTAQVTRVSAAGISASYAFEMTVADPARYATLLRDVLQEEPAIKRRAIERNRLFEMT